MREPDLDPAQGVKAHPQHGGAPPEPEPGKHEEHASTTPTKNSVSDAVFTSVFLLGMANWILWGVLQSPLATKIALFLTALFYVGWGALIWRKGQTKSAWETFARQARLLLSLAVTVLGAPAIAIALRPEDRDLAFKLLAIVLLSFLPAWLYWQFVANKGRALWDEFVINLYRLGVDNPISLPRPPKHSVFYHVWKTAREGAAHDAADEHSENLYRKKFEGVYGALSDESSQRVLTENAIPVVFATVFISLGWVLLLQPEVVYHRWIFESVAASGARFPLAEIGFAFLGAYFYVVPMLMRRYYQNDLKTSAYINVSVRIVSVVIITWILTEVWRGEAASESSASAAWRYGVAFTIGVFPDVGWQVLQRALKWPIGFIDKSFRVRYPLSTVDGLNLWYESRLLEEGIEDLPTLTTANVVDVMLHTRIPIDRLVNWLDQAVLLLHVPDGQVNGDADRRASNLRVKLDNLGIRTATDLLALYDRSTTSFRVPPLKPVDAATSADIGTLVTVAELVRREPVLFHVVQWKTFARDYLTLKDRPSMVDAGHYMPSEAQRVRSSLGIEPMSPAEVTGEQQTSVS